MYNAALSIKNNMPLSDAPSFDINAEPDDLMSLCSISETLEELPSFTSNYQLTGLHKCPFCNRCFHYVFIHMIKWHSSMETHKMLDHLNKKIEELLSMNQQVDTLRSLLEEIELAPLEKENYEKVLAKMG